MDPTTADIASNLAPPVGEKVYYYSSPSAVWEPLASLERVEKLEQRVAELEALLGANESVRNKSVLDGLEATCGGLKGRFNSGQPRS